MYIFITFHTELNFLFQTLQLLVMLILWKSFCYKWAVVQMKWKWLSLPLSASVWCCVRRVFGWISLSDHTLAVSGGMNSKAYVFPPHLLISLKSVHQHCYPDGSPRVVSAAGMCVLNLVEWVWVSCKWTQTPQKGCIIVLSCIHVLMEQNLRNCSTDAGWFQVDE